MAGPVQDDPAAEEPTRGQQLYEPFTHAVRALVDAAIRTTVADDEVRAAQAEIMAIVARLRASQIEGAYGACYPGNGRQRAWGNTVVGLRNAAAPPLHIGHDSDGNAWSDFHLGAAYEGPPGLVHGGVAALILDQMLGEAAGAGGRPGMTGTLTLTYRAPTPLGALRAEAWIDRSEGIKTWAKGRLLGPDGVTVEAEGVFILPRWARAAHTDGDTDSSEPPAFFE